MKYKIQFECTNSFVNVQLESYLGRLEVLKELWVESLSGWYFDGVLVPSGNVNYVKVSEVEV